jgi:uncharacterized protein
MQEDNWVSKWSKERIRTLLLEQYDYFRGRDTGVPRENLAELLKTVNAPHAVIISGLRRVGKSTLLAQIAHHLGEQTFYYINFEDERFLGFRAEDAQSLYQALIETFGPKTVFLIDEIQNVTGWEHFVRRFMDQGIKFYITGSNASLLSRELGNRLTGRYVPIELLPFSFREFLVFKGYEIPDLDRMKTTDQALLKHRLEEYMEQGGLPEPLKYPELPLQRALYDDVLYRDIAARYHLEDLRALKELSYFLMSNPAGLISFNKLKGQLKLRSVNTVKNYIDYLESAWLFFMVNVHDYSVRRQQIAPKKIYAIDTGLSKAVGFAFSPNRGRLLENLVFLSLRRREREIYYLALKTGQEVDFYLPRSGQLIQVAENMAQKTTRDRELRALKGAMETLPGTRGLVLTDSDEEPLEWNDKSIRILSLSRWLLENPGGMGG